MFVSFLQCVTSHWEQTKQCSHCGNPVAESSLNLKKCFQTLKILFPEIHIMSSDSAATNSQVSHQKFTIVRLNGEAAEITYKPNLTIHQVKGLVKNALSVTPDKQRLVYNGTEMKVCHVWECFICNEVVIFYRNLDWFFETPWWW